MLENVPPEVFDWAVRLIGAALVAMLGYRPALWAWSKVRGQLPATITTTTVADNRPELNAALRLIADHAASLECPDLKRTAERAVTDLAPIVLRPPNYQPPEITYTV